MKLLLDKSKCKFTESVNGFVLEVDTIEPVEFIGGNGRNYILYDENEEGIGPDRVNQITSRKMNQSELYQVLDGAYSDWSRNIEKWGAISALGAKLSKDGNKWCFLWGENLQEGVAGFGDTIADAALDFYQNLYSEKIISTQ